MPVTLVVRSGEDVGAPSRALTFDGTRVVIGRGSGCDVRLPDPSVSQRHATLRAQGSDYALVDEGSGNGTFVGGVRLQPQNPRVLRTGDMIRIGRVWLEVQVGAAPPTPDLALATRELALALVAQAMGQGGADTVPRVRIVEGPDLGAELLLAEEGRVYVIGRGEQCDIALADPDASREHVQLVRRGAQVLVRDVGSRNGAFLGDVRVHDHRDAVWTSQAMLLVGQTVLALEEPVAAALAELEAMEDESMVAGETPAAPMSSAELESPPSGALPLSQQGSAPMAPRPSAAPEPVVVRSKKHRILNPTDWAIIVTALAVIGVSLAGLYWLLRG